MSNSESNKPYTLTISANLYESLMKKAEMEHSNVDRVAEDLLYDAIFFKPNAETIEAIEEARAGKYAGVINSIDDFDALVDSL